MQITTYQMFLGFSGMTGLMMAFVLLVLHLNYPKTVRGLSEWGLSSLCLATSSLLYIGRGIFPDVLTRLIANILLIAGVALLYHGLEKFSGQNHRTFKKCMWLVIAYVSCALCWFIYVEPDFRLRSLLVVSAILFLYAATLVLGYRNFKKTFGHYFLSVVLLGMVLGWLARAYALLNGRVVENFQDDISNQFVLFGSTPLMISLMALAAVVLASEKLRMDLERKNQFDSLTQALTRAAFMQELEKEIKRCLRQKTSFALLMLDLDDFKSVNDTHGHQQGDSVLIDFSTRVLATLRELDSFGRFGGDEFVVLLPGADAAGARAVCDRIHAAGLRTDQRFWKVSIGIAVWDETLDAKTLIELADRDLYQAKALGRAQQI